MSQQSIDSRWRVIQNDVVLLLRKVGTLQEDLAETQKKAREDQKRILLAMLDVLDAFERVFANIEPREQTADRQARTWVGNFRSVRDVLEDHLENFGVVRIEAQEGKVVPGCHIVEKTQAQWDLPDGAILEELEKGYLWQGEVLRKARVITVRN